jgi:HK97 family phage major capsid protein
MEMTLEQVVGAVAKELNLEKLFGDDKNRAALAVIINKATADLEQKLTSEIAEERKLRTAAEEGIAELRERMARREKLERDFDFHVGRDGKTIMPTLSRECGEHLLALMRGKGKAFDEARALSAGTDSEGGYMVAPEFAAEIIRLLPTVGLYRRLARIIPMKTDEKNFGTLVSSVSTYWPAENNNITASYPVFGQLKLIAKLMGAYTEGPENLFDDADPDLINFIGDLFIETMAKEEDRVGLAGATGSGDAFDGILNITGTTSLVMPSTKTHYSDVTADHLLDLQTTVPDGARDNCIYCPVADDVRLRPQDEGQQPATTSGRRRAPALLARSGASRTSSPSVSRRTRRRSTCRSRSSLTAIRSTSSWATVSRSWSARRTWPAARSRRCRSRSALTSASRSTASPPRSRSSSPRRRNP